MPFLFVIFSCCVVHSKVLAQSCHGATVRTAESSPHPTLSLQGSVVHSEYRLGILSGNYQGLGLRMHLIWDRLDLLASIHAYRLNKAHQDFPSDVEEIWGTGDLFVSAKAVILRSQDHSGWQLSTGIHLMLPTGTARDGISMGHAMMGPETLLSFGEEHFSFAWGFIYLQMFSNNGHLHGTSTLGQWPLVDPHLGSELGGSFAAMWHPLDWMTLRAVTYGASPLHADGNGRWIVSPSILFHPSSHTQISLDAEFPVLGNPYTYRVVLGLETRFNLR